MDYEIGTPINVKKHIIYESSSHLSLFVEHHSLKHIVIKKNENETFFKDGFNILKRSLGELRVGCLSDQTIINDEIRYDCIIFFEDCIVGRATSSDFHLARRAAIAAFLTNLQLLSEIQEEKCSVGPSIAESIQNQPSTDTEFTCNTAKNRGLKQNCALKEKCSAVKQNTPTIAESIQNQPSTDAELTYNTAKNRGLKQNCALKEKCSAVKQNTPTIAESIQNQPSTDAEFTYNTAKNRGLKQNCALKEKCSAVKRNTPTIAEFIQNQPSTDAEFTTSSNRKLKKQNCAFSKSFYSKSNAPNFVKSSVEPWMSEKCLPPWLDAKFERPFKGPLQTEAELSKLDSNNIGTKIMSKMGWCGAGLGKNEQGDTSFIQTKIIKGRPGIGKNEQLKPNSRFTNPNRNKRDFGNLKKRKI